MPSSSRLRWMRTALVPCLHTHASSQGGSLQDLTFVLACPSNLLLSGLLLPLHTRSNVERWKGCRPLPPPPPPPPHHLHAHRQGRPGAALGALLPGRPLAPQQAQPIPPFVLTGSPTARAASAAPRDGRPFVLETGLRCRCRIAWAMRRDAISYLLWQTVLCFVLLDRDAGLC